LEEAKLNRIALLLGLAEPSLFKDYLDHVTNRALLPYKTIFQYGGKSGQSLYTHVMDGIFVLETLRSALHLTDDEARVLFTAYTVHDINKVLGTQEPFSKLATTENIAAEITRLGLDAFFPAWQAYLTDITSLVRGHSGHHHAGGERWVVKGADRYRLGLKRVNALLHLMRAVDVVDLSHTLEEQRHKADFLGHLNAYLADSGQAVQYTFFTHRLSEMRGLLTNVIHNSIVRELRDAHGLTPLLFYPDGVAYLIDRTQELHIGPAERQRMAARVAESLAQMTSAKFRDFISSRGQGIRVNRKCLELGIPFCEIWREIYNRIQRRTYRPEELEARVRERTRRTFAKTAKAAPEAAKEVAGLLEGDTPLVAMAPERLRLGELVRTYYIFLNEHLKDIIPDAWEHIYRLLDVPQERWPCYSYFDARYDRAYVLARDLTLDEEALYRRIEEDGSALVDDNTQGGEDPRVALFSDYLARYALFGREGRPAVTFDDHLSHYVANQHRQCVTCGGPFPTAKWMTDDVRSDITVQTFSNRLRGGPGEPKKYVCAVCQIQFLLEKLNYPTVRGEHTMYLHLFPYAFLTEPFIEGLLNTVRRITTEDTAVQALNLDQQEAIPTYLAGTITPPAFRTRTAKDKPQPYGLYLPRYDETVGNLLIFPINPGGDNDTQRFLFVLWNALVLQRHFGVKVLLTEAPVAPLDKEAFTDLYVDNIPLACRGLLPRNDYAQFADGTDQPGALAQLWEQVGHLFALQRLTYTAGGQDGMSVLVRAMGEVPLTLFYETEKLIEAHARAGGGQAEGGLITWLSQQAFPHVEALALSKGGDWMTELSAVLRKLAEIAWQNGLRGRSLEKSSLLFPLDEVLAKLAHAGGPADREALMAAAAMDIFDHLSRIAEEQYKPGRRKWEATKAFVGAFFADLLDGVYHGNVRRLLADEKLLRSAFLFYVREQIPHKREGESDEDEMETESQADESRSI